MFHHGWLKPGEILLLPKVGLQVEELNGFIFIVFEELVVSQADGPLPGFDSRGCCSEGSARRGPHDHGLARAGLARSSAHPHADGEAVGDRSSPAEWGKSLCQ